MWFMFEREPELKIKTCVDLFDFTMSFKSIINDELFKKKEGSPYYRSFAERLDLVDNLFKHSRSISGLLDAVILYPDDHTSITTSQYLELESPYDGTWTGYKLIDLELIRDPNRYLAPSAFIIQPIFDPRQLVRNYRLPVPNLEVTHLDWEHYTVRHR